MVLYRTVLKAAEAEQVIDKSRFIGYVKPVESKEEAEDFISEIKEMNKNATHNVPAYVVGDHFQFQWASDDGEPQGTSGAPIVQMLVKEDITNIALVITRYFGGIKLGTGGLVRAYTGTAKLALEAAGICDVKEMVELRFRLDYSCFGKLQNLSSNGSFSIGNTTFEDVVVVDLMTDPENKDELKTMISNLTGGGGRLISETKNLVKCG